MPSLGGGGGGGGGRKLRGRGPAAGGGGEISSFKSFGLYMLSTVSGFVGSLLLIMCCYAARRLITWASKRLCAARARLGSRTVAAGPAPSAAPATTPHGQEQA